MVIGCTGSVATVKIPELVVELVGRGYEVRVVLSSEAALHFFVQSKAYNSAIWSKFMAVGGYSLILSDKDEWSSWKKVGDPVLHVQLCKWADILVIAPASANTLSKLKNGAADSLLLSTYAAWDYHSKWIILAPAMNTLMWANSAMEEVRDYFGNRFRNEKHRILVIEPAEKLLACGDTGKGAMASVTSIGEKLQSVVERGSEYEFGIYTVDDSDKDKSQISHPALLTTWASSYAWSPVLRVQYYWRYSPFCVSNRGWLRFLGSITTTVVVVSAMMALTGGASFYKLQTFVDQKVESLKAKLPSWTRPSLPTLEDAKEKLSGHATTLKKGASSLKVEAREKLDAKLNKLEAFKRKQG